MAQRQEIARRVTAGELSAGGRGLYAISASKKKSKSRRVSPATFEAARVCALQALSHFILRDRDAGPRLRAACLLLRRHDTRFSGRPSAQQAVDIALMRQLAAVLRAAIGPD